HLPPFSGVTWLKYAAMFTSCVGLDTLPTNFESPRAIGGPLGTKAEAPGGDGTGGPPRAPASRAPCEHANTASTAMETATAIRVRYITDLEDVGDPGLNHWAAER